jgi:hypothetical protein
VKRSKDEKSIRLTIMMPLWLHSAISFAYIVTIMVIPFGYKVREDTRIVLVGRGNIFNYIMIVFVLYTSFRIRGFFDDELPVVFLGIVVKFIQIVSDYFLLKNSMINYYSLMVLLFIELALSLIEYTDKKNFKYSYEKL